MFSFCRAVLGGKALISQLEADSVPGQITPPCCPFHSLTVQHTGVAEGHPLTSLPADVGLAPSAMGNIPDACCAVCRHPTHSQAQPLCQPSL